MKSKILKNAKDKSLNDTKNKNQYVKSNSVTSAQLRKPSSRHMFIDKYKPSRKQLFALDQSVDKMAISSGHSRELIYHSLRDAFCHINEVWLPETYQGFRNAKQRFGL